MMAADGFVVPTELGGKRVVDVAREHLGVVARRAIGPLIADGALLIDGRPGRIAQPVVAGQRLALVGGALDRLAAARQLTPPSAELLVMVHEDDDLLVVDKPPGLHVHPMGRWREDTLLGRVLWHVGARPVQPWTTCRPSPAHRLDRPTSGLVLFARTTVVRDQLQRLFDAHDVDRTYEATVVGDPADDEGVVDLPLGPDLDDGRRRVRVDPPEGGRPARSRWRVLKRGEGTARLELHLETGRTHQLRAHLAHLGHPIVGDVDYGAPSDGTPADPRVGCAIALRAVALRLPHPGNGTPLVIDVRHP